MRKFVEKSTVRTCSKGDAGPKRLSHVCVEAVRRRLVHLVAFLLFKEENPKHGCWTEFSPAGLAVYILAVPLVCTTLLIAGWMYGGVPGVLIAYVIDCVLPLELLHCLFDR